MRIIVAEWQKIFFLKSSRIYLIFAAMASTMIGLILCLTTRVTQGRTLFELEPMEIISVNMLGVDIWTIFLVLFIAVRVGREFQERTIRSYLLTVPTRSCYFFSKAILFLFIALMIGTVVSLVALMNGRILVAVVHKRMPLPDTLLQFLIGCVVMPSFYSLLTVCATFFAGNVAAGIAIPVSVLFLPALVKLFPEMLQSVLIPFLPASAIHTLSGAAEKGSIEYIGTVAAIFVLGVWILVFAAVAIRKFCKKDL